MKNRKGFTLMEMVVVIAIIVFLSAVTLTSIAQYTKRARDLSTNVRAHNAAMASEEEIVDNYLTTTRSTEGNATTNNSHQAIVPTESETESTTEATTTKKQNPPPPQDPPHEDPTTVTTTKSQETQPNNPPAPPANNQNPTQPANNQNAAGSSFTMTSNQYDHWGNRLKFNKAIKEAIIKTDGNGFAVDLNGQYTVENLGGNRYKVNFVADGWGTKAKEIPFHVDWGYKEFVIESFS